MSSNSVKATLLGEPFGTANSKLKKALLYEFAKRLEMDSCFKCGSKILTIKEFSIEHKKSWMRSENPIEAFFSIDNIAFSHIACNVSDRTSKYSSDKERNRARYEVWYGNSLNREGRGI